MSYGVSSPQVVCLSPTFDLAQQTGSVLQQMAKFLPVKMVYAVRGMRGEEGGGREKERVGRRKGRRKRKRGHSSHVVTLHFAVESRQERTEHIVMGTSGTTLDWILKKKVIDPKKVTMFVLDEADVMIDQQGQQDQTIRIQRSDPLRGRAISHVRHLCVSSPPPPSHLPPFPPPSPRLLSKTCQMVLFSATYNEEVMKFAGIVIPDPVIMRLKRSEESLNNIKQVSGS